MGVWFSLLCCLGVPPFVGSRTLDANIPGALELYPPGPRRRPVRFNIIAHYAVRNHKLLSSVSTTFTPPAYSVLNLPGTASLLAPSRPGL